VVERIFTQWPTTNQGRFGACYLEINSGQKGQAHTTFDKSHRHLPFVCGLEIRGRGYRNSHGAGVPIDSGTGNAETQPPI
jgi:hypothetical protein